MSKELDEIVLNCDHELIVEIGQTDEETTLECFDGRTHYYLNCLVCSTTLLRDESFYKGYVYTGVDLNKNQPMYRRKDYKNE